MGGDIAIVGGGAAAALVAYRLHREGVSNRARVFAPGPSFGRGLAYSTRLPAHLMNVRAAKLSVDAEWPLDFSQWAGVPADAFAPRSRYGDYLEERTQGLVAREDAQVIDFERTERGFRLLLESGRVEEARQVVLALGLAPPVRPAFARELPGGLFQNDPWAPLPGLPRDAPVVLIGTGLTAIDVLLSLEAVGHRGRVTAISRHGLLPRPHAASQGPALAFEPPVTASLRVLMRAVRREIERHGDWRAVLDALRPHSVALWQRLPIEERARWLRHVRRMWEVHRHRLAPEIARRVDEWRRAERLEVVRGRVDRVQAGGRGLVVDVGRRRIEAALAVNCTGPSLDPAAAHDLRKRLLEREIATRHPLGLGVRATAEGELVDPHGNVVRGLFTLGALLAGERWETTAIPEIRAQAGALARILARRA